MVSRPRRENAGFNRTLMSDFETDDPLQTPVRRTAARSQSPARRMRAPLPRSNQDVDDDADEVADGDDYTAAADYVGDNDEDDHAVEEVDDNNAATDDDDDQRGMMRVVNDRQLPNQISMFSPYAHWLVP